MFTGIITHQGTLCAIERDGDTFRITLQSPLFSEDEPPKIGDSVAVSGVCLTVVDIDSQQERAQFDISSETMRATTLHSWEPGTTVNLERALRLSDRLDGHLVQGHVDCVATVQHIEEEANTYRLSISLPKEIAPLIAPKGSICIDGVSLTVGEVGEQEFSVYIIPHTWEETTARKYRAGQQLNLEADCIARYVQRLLQAGS